MTNVKTMCRPRGGQWSWGFQRLLCCFHAFARSRHRRSHGLLICDPVRPQRLWHSSIQSVTVRINIILLTLLGKHDMPETFMLPLEQGRLLSDRCSPTVSCKPIPIRDGWPCQTVEIVADDLRCLRAC